MNNKQPNLNYGCQVQATLTITPHTPRSYNKVVRSRQKVAGESIDIAWTWKHKANEVCKVDPIPVSNFEKEELGKISFPKEQ